MRRQFHIARRLLLVAALPLLLQAGPAWAQPANATATATGAAPAFSAVGVFALLGDGLQIAQPGDITDSRLDRTLRDTLTVKEVGFDQAALRAVRAAFGKQQPAAQLHMFRATTAMNPADQRALADGATRAELPAWIVSAIESAKLSHVLIITRSRGDASFAVAEGFDIGRGKVEGIGYYVDSGTEMKDRSSGQPSTGFLGAYVQLRLQLIDARSGDMVASHDVRVGEMHLGKSTGTDGANIWGALGPVEKVNVLRRLVEAEVARVVPTLLAAR